MSSSFFSRQSRWVAVLVFAVLLPATVAADSRIPIADFVRLGNFSAPAMSPDGKYLVVTQRTAKEPRDEYATVVYELAGMKIVSAVRVAERGDVPWRHTWVSDTRFVTSLAHEYGTVGKPWLTGELVAANVDGRGNAYLYGFRRMSSRTSGSFGTLTNDEGYGWLAQVPRSAEARVLMGENPWAWGATARTSRLYDIDTVTTGRRTVTEINQPGFGFVVDADGKPRFAYGFDDAAEYAVFKLDDEKREWLPFVNAEKGDLRPFSISLDKTTLLSTLSVQRGPRALVSQKVDGSERRTLVEHATGNIDEFEWGLRYQGPFAAGTSVGVPKLSYIVDPTRSDAALHKTLSAQFPGQYVHFASVSQDGTRTLFSVSGDRDPGAIYVFDAPSGKAALLFENRPWIKPERMAEQRPVNFKARDGMQLHGYLTLPPNRGDGKLPLVLLPHGGPHGIADEWFFDTDAQFLASRGYAVLQVNFRGSGGRGPAFETAGYRQWGGLMTDDLVDGMRWTVAQGVVDEKRICSFGASFGAYAAMMTAIRAPELVKCAIGYAGVYDLPMIYDEPDAKRGGKAYQYYLKALGQDMTELNAYSPARLADKLGAPVLLVHGSADEVTPPAQAHAMREALTKAGRPPEWFYVSGEGHGFYAEKNRAAFYEKLEAFLAKHIGKP
ncbi:MAG: S9 family peptidase [Burkholderiaceae bacterium]